MTPPLLIRRLGVIVCLLLAACGGRQRPSTDVEVRVATVKIEGNHSIGTGTLLAGLALRRAQQKGQELDPYLVGQDQERLRGVYVRRGFFRVVVGARVEQRGERAAAVTFTIDEGPRAHLARVEIVGLPDDPQVSATKLRRLIPLADGEPFVYEVYDEAKPRLVAALERVGYAHVRLEASVAADRVRDEAIIRLEYQPGPLSFFGKVELRGVTGPLADAAYARLGVREGRRYSSALLAESQAALYDMGRFSAVRLEPDKSTRSSVVPVSITVVEASRHELRLGGGFGVDPTAYEVRGRSDYSITGWPTTLTSTRLELRPAYVLMRDDEDPQPRIEALVGLERIDLFRSFLTGQVEASFAYLAVEAFTSVGPRVRLGLRSPIGSHRFQLGVGWQIRVLDFPRIDEAIDDTTAAALGLESPYVLGFYEQSLSADLRDDPVEPHRGVFAELRVEEGSKAAGGEFEYVRITPDLRGYVPLGKLVLAARGRFGMITGELPITQRYLAGGASSQRGFPERRLAPTVTRVLEDGTLVSAVVGGGALLETGIELRVPIGTWRKLKLGTVAFLDGADVTERAGDLDPAHLHWAAGLGLRVATPVGPVRLDVGYRLNRAGTGELRAGERFAFHLSLGEAF